MYKEYQTLHYCPNNCPNATFETVAHVAQDWEVDAFGSFISAVNGCSEVVAEPDNGNIWTCRCCGVEAKMARVRFGGTVEAPTVDVQNGIREKKNVLYAYYVDDSGLHVFYRAHGNDNFTMTDVEHNKNGEPFFVIHGVRVRI